MGAEFLMFVLLFSFAGGEGGGDLLDFANTENYWQMREQRIVNVETMGEILEDDDATPTDRLMAIRALGELGAADDADDEDILELLEPLSDSEAPFVSEYVARSIAWVNGEEPQARARTTPQEAAADLRLLTEDCFIAGQWRLRNGSGPVDMAAMIPEGLFGGFGAEQDEVMMEMNGAVMEMIAMMGNARVDTITMGMGIEEDADEPSHATFIFRGQYDRMNLLVALEETLIAQQEDVPAEFRQEVTAYSINDIEVIRIGGEWEQMALVMPSDNVLVWMVGEGNRGEESGLPIEAVAERLQAEEPELALNETLMTEIGKIDREAAGLWVAFDVVPALAGNMDELFGPYNAAHIFGVLDEDSGAIDIAWEMVGENEDAVADNVATLNAELAEGVNELREEFRNAEPEFKPMFGPMLQVMESIFIQSEGATMNGGLTLPPGGPGSLMGMLFMGF